MYHLRPVLLGQSSSLTRRYLAYAVVLGLTTTALYATGIFSVSGGVVFVPAAAAIVGFVAATVVTYRNDGLFVAWVVAYAPLLGFKLCWALFWLSNRPLAERIAYFFSPDGLVFLGVEAILIGTLGFVLGAAIRRSLERVRRSRSST